MLFLIVLTAVTLITLDSRAGDSGPLGAIGRLAHQIVDPVVRLTDRVMTPIQNWFGGVLDAGSLREENDDLRRELARLQAREAQFDDAVAENARLKALFGQPYLDAIESKVGRVIQYSPGNFERTITLNIGSEDGIEAGMPVVAPGGLVGKVLQSWSGGSKVLLLVDDRFGVGVRMVRAPQALRNGFAEGSSSGDDLRVDVILERGTFDKRALLEGDEVVTSGLETSEFPPNIPLGEISSIQPGAQGLSVRLRVRPFVEIDSLDYVKVLLWRAEDDVVPQTLIDADPSQGAGPPGLVDSTTTTTVSSPGASVPPTTEPSLP